MVVCSPAAQQKSTDAGLWWRNVSESKLTLLTTGEAMNLKDKVFRQGTQLYLES